jgi:multidrug efflux pump subunit AcrB
VNRAIAWFAQNPVAANLLMLVLLIGGFLSVVSLRQEVFPEFSTDTISVPYLGAAPEEVEEGVCIRIEEQIQGINGIKRITSKSSEGSGSVTIELLEGADARTVLDEVKARVDAIETFPEEVESPVIQEVLIRQRVINIAISGPASERTLKTIGERIRDEISALPDITQVELSNARPYEVSIEISEEALRRYGLRFEDVASAVRRSSLDLPGGSIRAESGEILLRTKGQAYRGDEFENLTLISRIDGTQVRLGDIARVVDGFAETDQRARFDGYPAVMVQVFRVGNQSAVKIADQVREYVEAAQVQMPEGIRLTTWQNDAELLRSRLDLLLRNGRMGFLLVMLILALFLRLKLSFWTSLGIPISFMGTFLLLPSMDISINMISLLAFIMVLGIVVDDAIVVGENIYRQFEEGKSGIRAAVDGTVGMAVPVCFAVFTTAAAFAPMLVVPGTMGKMFKQIPLVIIPTLLFSLVECLFILPAHLSHLNHRKREPRGFSRLSSRLRKFFDRSLKIFIQHVYRPSLELALSWRYATVALALVTLALTAALLAGGRIKFEFMPDIEADNVTARLTMPLGTPVEVTTRAVERLESTLAQVRSEVENRRLPGQPEPIRHVLSSIGDQPSLSQSRGPMGGVALMSGAHLAEVDVELALSEDRSISSMEISDRWRELTGDIPDAVKLDFSSSLMNAGDPINIQLTGNNVEELRSIASELRQVLAAYPGVYDISDSFRAGKKEVKLRINPEAEVLGLSQMDLARQVRQAFYGEEAQRIQRGRDDIRIMVRYPQDRRVSLGDLEQMRIRAPGGVEVPFSTVAQAELGRGYSAIDRVDRRRAINVTAKVDSSIANENEIIARLTGNELREILSGHPSVMYSLEGEQREQQDVMVSLGRASFMALIGIFALLAIPLRSYLKPVIIMTAIPFGLVGAILGHLIQGMNISVISLLGFTALAGVVVNDSLILVDFINRNRRPGVPLREVVRESGMVRFRPILLTSLTTFGGLTPLLLEKSLQARFMVPMAISLAYGVVFATFITLVLIPAEYMILEDIKRVFYRWIGRKASEVEGNGFGAEIS